MEKRTCPCGVLCTGNYICLSCSGDEQARQERFEDAIELAERMRRTLRDEFAMRALSTVMLDSESGGNDESGSSFAVPVRPDRYYTDRAYEWADLMLGSRKLPESG